MISFNAVAEHYTIKFFVMNANVSLSGLLLNNIEAKTTFSC
jgi:hypothetical protein